MGNFILILCLAIFSQWTYAQNKQISGRVVDTKGKTAIGASIPEKGATNGTITDFDGNFELTVGPEAVLQIGYTDYKTQEIPVANKTKLNITVEEDTEVLDEVIVVDYGAQKKEGVVGAISRVSSKELLKSPVANISQAITGKTSGVITSQTSGAPGADGIKIYVHGRASSAGDSQPLILVNSVEREFSQITPDGIESVPTLKDASATAVYGVRGVNGVMLIIAKRDEEQKPTVSLTTNWQIQSPTRQDTYLDSYNSVVLLEEVLTNNGLPSQYSASGIEVYKKASAGQLSGIDALLYPNVDWYDTVLRNNTPVQRYDINVRGDTKCMRYFTSAEYHDQRGLFEESSQDECGNKSNSSFKRFVFHANLDFLMTKDLTLSVSFGTRFEERGGSNSNESRGGTYSQAFYGMNHTPGWLSLVSYTVNEGRDQKTLYSGSSQYQNNIVARFAKAGFYRSTNTIDETDFIVDYKVDWLTKRLAARGMISFDCDTYCRRAFSADFATYGLNGRTNYNSIDAYTQFNTDTELAYLGNDQTTTYKLYMEFQLDRAHKFDKHDITAMVLYNQNDYRYQTGLAGRYQGLIGRATYGCGDRYLAEVNFDYNGSESFMRGRRFGFFPSFSIGWKISNKAFMKGTEGWLNNLRIHASYGEIDNNVHKMNGVKQRFLYQTVWTQMTNDYYFGTAGYTSIYESQYPNYAVVWEHAHKYNLGLEFGLQNGLLNGNIDVFYEERNDILTPYLTRPQWVDVSMATDNLGEVSNKGSEIELKYANHIGKDFIYDASLTFSHIRNEIRNMDESATETACRKQEGHPIDQYSGLVCDGFVTQTDLNDPDFPVPTLGNAQVGDLKYRDMNGNGFIDGRNKTFIGYSDVPENTYALSLGYEYKGVGFSIMFQGVGYVSRYYDVEAVYAFVSGGKVKEYHLNRWNPDQLEAYNLTHASYPLLYYDSYSGHNQRKSSSFLKNGNFLRLKNIELSYSLPARWVRKVAMNGCRVYVNTGNLITWGKLDGLYNPESEGSNRYPTMKVMNFGVNIKFQQI